MPALRVWWASCEANPTFNQDSAKAVRLNFDQNGKQGYYISCDLAASDWTVCYEQAAKICNGKYAIVDKNETSTSTPYGPLVRRNMMVDCKN